jgi:hypothetical protein
MNTEDNNVDGIALATAAEFQDKVYATHQIICLLF